MSNPGTFSTSDLFEGIPQETQTEIHSAGKKLKFSSGEQLFQEGDPAHRAFLVLDGRLKLVKLHAEGKEAIVRYINAGEILAAIAITGKKNYPVTAQSVGNSEVIAWERGTLMELIGRFPQLSINLVRFAFERLDELQARVLEMRSEKVEQRLARALTRMLEKFGERSPEGILIGIPVSRQDLADFAGTNLFTVSRTLSQWEKEGILTSGRENLLVHKPDSLKKLAKRDDSPA